MFVVFSSVDNLSDRIHPGEVLSDREQKIRLIMNDRENEFTTQKPLRSEKWKII